MTKSPDPRRDTTRWVGKYRRDSDERVCITTAQIQGYPFRLLVDTGMDGILIYHDRVPQFETGNLIKISSFFFSRTESS